MIWNDRMRKLREGTGVSLKDMADQLNVSEATVQRYEGGGIKQVPYEAIVAYAERFNRSPCYIMGWDDDDPMIRESLGVPAAIMLELSRDPEMLKALTSYFDLSPEKKKHIIENIKLLNSK